MTLAIAFKGSEGVVLAADSRVTINFTVPIPNSTDKLLIPATYDNATKLLKVAGQEHVAAVTFGVGTLGSPEPRTAHSLLPEFEAALAGSKRLSVEAFANKLGEFFSAQWKQRVTTPITGTMNFLVGGFDDKAAYGRVFDVRIPDAPKAIEYQKDFGLRWGGQNEIAARILNGFDDPSLILIKNKFSMNDTDTAAFGTEISAASGSQIPYQFLPLQDCVDLSILLIRTTAQLLDYQTNLRGVGGAIDVATITRQEGFKYVQRKELRGER